MVFNSLQFLLFFGAVTSLYFLLKGRARIWLLLIASCWFYISFMPAYILIQAATIIIDYFAGMYIYQSSGRIRKSLLIISIISNIGILFFFKYANFFIENINHVSGLFGSTTHVSALDFILPIGLSFHTFQALSYTIEVYRGKQKPEYDFVKYALYVMFYPQLVAGPIERPQNVLHQFDAPPDYDRTRFRQGVLMVLTGLIKKVVIADHLAVMANPVFSNVGLYSALDVSLAVVLFAFQIYCDFSAYSEIALGTAHLMGFDLMVNFRAPYFSKSIAEFWSRWHISLSTWFRDYVYIPLGGNRKGFIRTQINLMVVFLISGFWHGANWGFIIWGGLHGMYLILANCRNKLLGERIFKLPAPLNIIWVFALATFAWVFFRAATLSESIAIFSRILHGSWSISFADFRELIFAGVLLLFLFIIERKHVNVIPSPSNYFVKIGVAIAVLYFLGEFNGDQFIYFQF